MRQWRLIYDKPTSGMRNMAVDEAVLRTVAAGSAPPTLRFYDWQPPCLSLGYGQKSGDIDFNRVLDSGWQVVRRPTGGRAILHIDELTYSVAVPANHPLADGDVVSSYRRISRALLAGLEAVGIRPRADRQAERKPTNGPVCFETPSHYEITAGGRKLVGSAQVRRFDGVLQHGSLPLYGDVTRICDALVYDDDASREEAKAQVRARATTLFEALEGHLISWRALADALVDGFATTFDIDFVETTLSDAELACADDLVETVYANDEWTRRR